MPTVDELAEVCRKWNPRSLATYYEWVQAEAGFKLPAHIYPVILALCDTRIKKLMLTVGPGSGKSLVLSNIYLSWLIGHDPTQTILEISGAENLAQGFMASVMATVDRSPVFKAIFPNVLPDKDSGWSNEKGMFVTGHIPTVPDASFWACGLTSKALTGKHARTIVLDDLHDADNSSTEAQCQGVVDRYATQIAGRADSMGARFILAGRRWHERDLYGQLQYNGDWVVLRLPAERKGETNLYHDVYVPEGIECVFTDGIVHCKDGEEFMASPYVPAATILPKRKDAKADAPVIRHVKWTYAQDPTGSGFFWPGNEEKREEWHTTKRLNPVAAESVYQCNPGARQGVIFIEEDFQRLYAPPENLALGVVDREVAAMCKRGSMVIQAWDTAFSASKDSDHTVCVTALLVYCDQYHKGEDQAVIGPCDPHYDVYILDVYREKLSWAELVPAARELNRRWQPNIVVIEKKAYGAPLLESLENSGIPLEPVMPIVGKVARAIDGVGAGSVQSWFRQHRVVMPADAPWADDFKREMKDFTGEKGGTDDQVDAAVHLVGWAIKNGGNGITMPAGFETPEAVDRSMNATDDPMAFFANMHAAFSRNSHDPFDGMCGRCRFKVKVIREKRIPVNVPLDGMSGEFCTFHGRMTSSLDSCDEFVDPNDQMHMISMGR